MKRRNRERPLLRTFVSKIHKNGEVHTNLTYDDLSHLQMHIYTQVCRTIQRRTDEGGKGSDYSDEDSDKDGAIFEKDQSKFLGQNN